MERNGPARHGWRGGVARMEARADVVDAVAGEAGRAQGALGKSSLPDSNQRPFGDCGLYSRTLYQLS